MSSLLEIIDSYITVYKQACLVHKANSQLFIQAKLKDTPVINWEEPEPYVLF